MKSMENVSVGETIILLFCLSIKLTYSTVIEDDDCKSWCITENNKNCSQIMNCGIEKRHDWYFPKGHHPPPKPIDFKIQLKCDNRNKSDIKLGLHISWKIRGEFIESGLVTHFVLLLEDNELLNDEFIKIIIPKNLSKNRYIKTEYFYHKTEDTFEIYRNGRYSVTIFSEPRMTNSQTSDAILHEVVPTYFEDQIEGCRNSTSVTVSPPTNSNEKYVIMIVISATFFTLTLIALVVVLKMLHKKKDGNSVKNIFIFLNPAVLGNEQLKEEIYKFSKLFSRKAQFEVRINLENNSTSDPILPKIQSNITWADIVTLASIPDDAEYDEEKFSAANNAVTHSLEVDILKWQHCSKHVIVVHSNDLQKHKNCPFLKMPKITKVHVGGGKWDRVYKKISANTIDDTVESQPLVTIDSSIGTESGNTLRTYLDTNTEEMEL
uniref:uncharacterized protein LOC120346445 n=1 Tax=Styela clava TaxID=7725 RepID=UPI00193A04FF|nr:uncharacterized protein LOC120346445 [Styela clava]